jgi:ubiquinone/menaquinone biosynthesis C-methylase UbiE
MGQTDSTRSRAMCPSDPCQVSVAVFDKLAARYADKYFDLDLYHAHLTRFAAAIATPSARVLDLACGPGNVSAFLHQIRPDWHLTGVDLAPAMLDQARARVPGVEFVVGDCRQLDCRQLDAQGRRFDGAAYAFGLSYLPEADAKRCLDSLYAVLTEGAPLYLATISGASAQALWEQGSSGDAVWMVYRTVPQILVLVQQAGFAIDWYEVMPSPANAAKATRDLVLLAHKQAKIFGQP